MAGFPSHAEAAHKYLINRLKINDKPEARFKLTPTEADRKLFCDIVDLSYPEIKSKYHNFFYRSKVPKTSKGVPTPSILRAYYNFWVYFWFYICRFCKLKTDYNSEGRRSHPYSEG